MYFGSAECNVLQCVLVNCIALHCNILFGSVHCTVHFNIVHCEMFYSSGEVPCSEIGKSGSKCKILACILYATSTAVTLKSSVLNDWLMLRTDKGSLIGETAGEPKVLGLAC